MAISEKLYKRDGLKLVDVENYKTDLEMGMNIHTRTGCGTAASLLHILFRQVWHPHLILCAQEVTRRGSNSSLRLAPQTIAQSLKTITPSPPLCRWGIDFTGPVTVRNTRSLLLNTIDYATGWAYSQRCNEGMSKDVMHIINTIIMQHGKPSEEISDDGSQFTSEEATRMLKALQIPIHKTTVYYPKNNGRCERSNGMIKEIIAATEEDNP